MSLLPFHFRDAEALKSVSRVDQLRDLAQLLDTEGKVFPLIVTVSGRVGSDVPINCKYSGLRGVIVEETAQQRFSKPSDVDSKIEDSAPILSMSKEVPWYLDDGTCRVHVVGAQRASGFELNVASEVFEESGTGRSLVRGALDDRQGRKMLGVKRTERVLPVGSSLTVVGEALKDDIGTVRIQRPHKGLFYVSPKTIDQLISYLGDCSRWLRYASFGLTAVGICLISKKAVEYIMKRKRRRESQKWVLAAAARRSNQLNEDEKNESGLDGSKREKLLPDICVICLEQEYNAVFVPCGHLCCCTTCSSHLTSCPLCRRRIKQAVRTFRH